MWPHRRQPTRLLHPWDSPGKNTGMDCSPPGSSVPGILQARTLEWVAISFSKAWKWKVKVKSLSRVRLLVTPWTAAHQAPPPMGFSRQEHWSRVPLPFPVCVVRWKLKGSELFDETVYELIITVTSGNPVSKWKTSQSCEFPGGKHLMFMAEYCEDVSTSRPWRPCGGSRPLQ